MRIQCAEGSVGVAELGAFGFGFALGGGAGLDGGLGGVLDLGAGAELFAGFVDVGAGVGAGDRARLGFGFQLRFGFEPDGLVLAAGLAAIAPELFGAAGNLFVGDLAAGEAGLGRGGDVVGVDRFVAVHGATQ